MLLLIKIQRFIFGFRKEHYFIVIKLNKPINTFDKDIKRYTRKIIIIYMIYLYNFVKSDAEEELSYTTKLKKEK